MVRFRLPARSGAWRQGANRCLAGLGALWLAFATVFSSEAASLRDRFAERETIQGASGTVAGSNREATLEAGEPRHARKLGGHSVWISWTAPASGIATFDTGGSDFDTLVAVYRLEGTNPNPDSLTALRSAAYGDDDNRQLTSAVDFGVEAGRTYEIAVDGFRGATGRVRLSWSMEAWERPAPEIVDQSPDQTLRAGDSVTIGFTQLSGEGWEAVWFFNGRALANGGSTRLTIPSFREENVGRYQVRWISGSVELSSEMIELQFNSEGLVYAMAQDKLLDAPGTGIEPGSLTSGGLRAMAIGVARGYNGQQGFSTLYAAKEAGEPDHCGQAGGASYWLAYQPPASGILTLDTAGSEFDTVLAVYVSDGPLLGYESLRSLICDDNGGPDGRTSRLQFAVEQDREYYVVVDGVGGAQGLAFLNYALHVPPEIVVQPISQTAAPGENVVFYVTAEGAAPLTYEWSKAGVAVPGGTGPELSLAGVTAGMAGSYAVRVSNAGGSVLSASAMLTVLAPPVFAEQPESLEATEGRIVSMRALAVGSPPLAYQWLKDGLPLSGATQAELHFASVAAEDTGTYAVRAANPAGSTESVWATLKVVVPPRLTLGPSPATAVLGQRASFLGAASGSAPLNFQWCKEGAPLAGQTGPELTLDPVTLADAGLYSLRVWNAAGAAESPSALLTVLAPPKVTQHPASVTVAQGRPVVLRSAATGSDPLQYQWQKDGRPVGGATLPELRLAAVAPADAGSYTIRISNTAGTAESNPALLKIKIPPSFVQHPVSLEAIQGASATFEATVSGSSPLEYQWVKDGIALPGATQPEYSIAAIGPEDDGAYSVRVSNSAGQAESDSAMLAVVVPPAVMEQPDPVTVLQGGAAWFRASATGSAPLTYQWLRNGDALAGQNSTTLMLNQITTAHAGMYSVRVSNRAGSVESERAELTVVALPSISQQPEAVLAVRGTTANFRVVAGGTGPLQYQWLREGMLLPGETGAALALANVEPHQGGFYSVRVSNPAGTIESWGALLTVLMPPEVVEPLASQTVPAGRPASFRIGVRGSEPIQYQWSKDGQRLPEVRGAELSIAAVTPADEGIYAVRISNPAGQIDAQSARLSVPVPPEILEGPKALTVAAGEPARFTVSVRGSPPLRYQWLRDGIELPGATAEEFHLGITTLLDTAAYGVRVANEAGSVESPAAQLTVLAATVSRIEYDASARTVVLRLATKAGASYVLEAAEGIESGPWATVARGIAASAEVSIRVLVQPAPAVFFRFRSSFVGNSNNSNLAPP